MIKRFALSLLTLILAQYCLAQSFEFSGQLRPRIEFRNGYHTLLGQTDDPALSISQRTRLNLNYSSGKLKTMISLQDVRIWGDVALSNKTDVNKPMIHQAWGEFLINKNLSVKVGRQALVYDDQRLFGGSDWVQQARSHDAVLLKWNPVSAIGINLGAAYNQSADKDTGTFYTVDRAHKAMQFLNISGGNKKDGFAYSLFLINVGMPFNKLEDSVMKQHIAWSQTVGPIIYFNKGKLSSNVSFYYQTGKNQKEKSKSAFFAGGEFNYKALSRLSAGAGFQYLSGNDQINPADKDSEFNTLFGTGHKFNGWMDYFFAGTAHKGVGLIDIYVPITYKNEKLSAEVQVHHYNAAAKIVDKANPGEQLNSSLGTEAGIMFTYNLSPETALSFGYSQMFATASMKALKGGDHTRLQNWAWMSLNFTPVFFKTEK